MLEELFNLVKGSAGDAVINNPDVPNEHNDAVVAEATNTVASGLRNMVSFFFFLFILSLFFFLYLLFITFFFLFIYPLVFIMIFLFSFSFMFFFIFLFILSFFFSIVTVLFICF